MSKKVYVDNGSTSFPKAPGVPEAVETLLKKGAFNVNRGSYEGAYEVEEMILETREQIAELFGAQSSRQVVFTPGITWSLNLLLLGLLHPGDHVVVSGMEHNAVMRPLHMLEKQGIVYSVAEADKEGTVSAASVERKIQDSTRLVLMIHASNVCGTIQPVEEIGRICMEKGIFFAVDTAQTAGSVPLEMEAWGIDFLAFTGHKGLRGPQGIGGFLISEKLDREMNPIITGGTGSHSDSLEQPGELPDKYESGTMNIPGIAGLHAALSYIEVTGIKRIAEKKRMLTEEFLEGVKKIPGISIVGKQGTKGRAAVVSLDFPQHDNAMVAFELEQKYGIMTRVGLHCAPEAHKSLGTFPKGTVRFSFSEENTSEEIRYVLKAMEKVINPSPKQ